MIIFDTQNIVYFLNFGKSPIVIWMGCAINFEFIAIYMTIICYKVVLHQFHVGGIKDSTSATNMAKITLLCSM